MKILIISTYFPPLNSIASLRPYSWAKHWSALGHDVTVLTAERKDLNAGLALDCSSFNVISAGLPKWHAKIAGVNQRETSKSSSERSGKVGFKARLINLAYRPLAKIRDRTGVLRETRMPSHLDCWYPGALKAVPSVKWDLVISTFSPYVTHLLAYRLKKSGQAKYWIADFRDLWVDHHLYSGLWPFKALESYFESKICRTADLVTTVSVPLVECLKKKYPGVNIVPIENGFDPDDFKGLDSQPFFSDQKIRLVYTGSYYPVLQPEPVFDAIKNIVEKRGAAFLDRFEVVFAGNGASLAKASAVKFGVERWVNAISLSPRDHALRMQRDADALLFLGFETPSAQGILSGKLFEYLNAGTEVWALGVSRNGAVGDVLYKSRAGVVLGNDVAQVERKIVELITAGVKRDVSIDKDIIARYDRKALAKRLLDYVIEAQGK